jgi:hypothetical protein
MCGKPVDHAPGIPYYSDGPGSRDWRPGRGSSSGHFVSTLSIVTTCMCNTGVHYIVRCRSGSGEGETKIQDRTTWTPSRSVSTVHLSSLSREYVWARFVIKIRRSIDGKNYRFRTFAHPKFSGKLNRMLKWSTTRREEYVFVVDAVDNKENVHCLVGKEKKFSLTFTTN